MKKGNTTNVWVVDMNKLMAGAAPDWVIDKLVNHTLYFSFDSINRKPRLNLVNKNAESITCIEPYDVIYDDGKMCGILTTHAGPRLDVVKHLN